MQRYLVWPGQATTYKVGAMTIQRLRDEARQALGPTFDYRAFHDVVLGGGSMPLPVLEARVRAGLQPFRRRRRSLAAALVRYD